MRAPGESLDLQVVGERDLTGRDRRLLILVRVDDDHAAKLVHARLGDHGLDERVGAPRRAQDAEDARILGTLAVGRLAQHEVIGRADAGRRLGDGRFERLPPHVHLLQDAHERVDHPGVELRAAALLKLPQALLVGAGAPVDPARRHRVVGVDHAEKPRHLGDLVARETVRVAAAVIALVMVAHAGHVSVVEKSLDDLGADGRMLLHQRPFLIGQRS